MTYEARHAGEDRYRVAYASAAFMRWWYMAKQPCVYILASRRNGTLYIGVTSDIARRVWEHKNHLVDGFTRRYAVNLLVWFEVHDAMDSAIAREKSLKEWKRHWKLRLIERQNPEWRDWYSEVA